MNMSAGDACGDAALSAGCGSSIAMTVVHPGYDTPFIPTLPLLCGTFLRSQSMVSYASVESEPCAAWAEARDVAASAATHRSARGVRCNGRVVMPANVSLGAGRRESIRTAALRRTPEETMRRLATTSCCRPRARPARLCE